MRIVFLVLLLVPLGWTKREYFLQSNASSWELARQHCQVCYRELATITAEDARHMLEKLDNSSRAVWVGLRRRLNETVASNTTNSTGPESHWFSGTAPWFQSSNDTNGTWFSFFEGKLPWSRWANGDPVTFQNWYPGRPVPKPRPEPIKCDPNAGASTYTTTPSYTTESGYSTVDGTSTTGMPNQNSTNGTAEQRNDTYMCPQLKKLLECVDDQGAKDALSRYLNQSSNATTPGSNQTDLNRSLNATTPDPADLYSAFPGTIPTSTSAPGTTSTSAATSTSAPSTTFTSAAPTTSPCPNVTDIREADLNRFIEDACLVLLSFGLWWERACSEVLPYVCYDDRFYGEVNVSDITYTSAGVKWLEAPGAISGYRVEVKSEEHNWTETLTSNLTTQFQNLTAGTKYTVCVFPIKCGRDLNPQTTYFYSQPDHIRNLTLVQIQETSVTLSWRPPPGGIDIYRLCVYNSSLQISCVNITSTIHTIKDLVAGGEHTVEVSAEVADMSIPGRRFNKTFFTKPNTVKELNVTKHFTTGFTVVWKRPDGDASSYRVLVNSLNGSMVSNESTPDTTYNVEGVMSGSKFLISVVAQVQNKSLEGKPQTTHGFTVPNPVSDLKLNATANTINAVWKKPEGDYLNISVTLYDPDGNKVENKMTPNASYVFTDLKAGANYTVQVYVLGVGSYTSISKQNSNFTLPNKPRNLEVISTNKTWISLKWDVPDKSEGVTILYNVSYKTKFWGESMTVPNVKATNVTLENLRPGTTYDFTVNVFAGNRSSEGVSVSGKTVPNIRNITFTMLCSSNQTLGCWKDAAQTKLLETLKYTFGTKLNGVFWELEWKKLG